MSQSDSPGLIGYQRAVFDRVESAQTCIGRLQIGLVLLTAISIFVERPEVSYFVAVSALGSAAIAFWIEHRAIAWRVLGERLRRVTLIANGLGSMPTANEQIDLRNAAASFSDDAKARDDTSYFATNEGIGPARLGAILEESAFWTGHLLRQSQRGAWKYVVFFVATAIFALLSLLPFATDGRQILLGQIVCALTMVVVSREVLGMALAFGRAADLVQDVLRRLQRCSAEAWPEAELIRLFADYNAAVENAPLPTPGHYAREKERINKLWIEHKAATSKVVLSSIT